MKMIILAVLAFTIPAMITYALLPSDFRYSEKIEVCEKSPTWWAYKSGLFGGQYDTGQNDIEKASKIAGDDRLFKRTYCRTVTI